jgi:hypothetical protein
MRCYVQRESMLMWKAGRGRIEVRSVSRFRLLLWNATQAHHHDVYSKNINFYVEIH